jgi:plastocyanin
MARGPRTLSILASIGILALSLAGCAATGTSQGAPRPVAATQVDLPKSYKFAPANIVVTVGSTVTWTNSDNFTHSVLFTGETAPGAVMKPGDSTTRTFDQVGTFAYICNFHPQDMRGTVVVTAASGSENP